MGFFLVLSHNNLNINMSKQVVLTHNGVLERWCGILEEGCINNKIGCVLLLITLE